LKVVRTAQACGGIFGFGALGESMPDRREDDAPGARSWLAANCHANQEAIALRHLARQNYEAYCPVFLKRRSHARRIEQVQRPLFPGYLFIRLNPDRDRWRPILSTIGVRTLVRFGERLGTISDDFIAGLRSREKDGLLVLPETRYEVGQEIRLSEGPFDGIVGTILSVDEKHRLVILMNLLQRPVRVSAHADQVKAI
jgi:transcriptional antiterminator RfaH